MPRKPVSAMDIKEILRLRLQLEMSERETSAHCGLPHSTVGDYTRAAKAKGLTWSSLEGLSDSEIWELLGKKTHVRAQPQKRLPSFEDTYKELRATKGATIIGLWEEYVEQDPLTAYQYTQYREYYHRYVDTLDVRMRCEHTAGEKLWVDYAGKTMPIWNRNLESIEFDAQIFVAVLGVGSLTYAEATRSQGLEEWMGSHERTFRFLGGVPPIWVPDNLKSAVDKPGAVPIINKSYKELARHHGSVVQPARVRKPRDKAKAENGVQLVERWILFKLRKHKFTSLDELNDAIWELLEKLNNRKLRNLPYTRREMFEKLDKPALLPIQPGYTFGRFVKAKVDPQYHVRVDKKYYSVPHQNKGKDVEARLSAFSVEVFYNGQRIALHDRLLGEKVYSTKIEHMPANHAAMVEESAENILGWARGIGPQTESYIDAFFAVRRGAHTSHGQAKGILMLARTYGKERLEAACVRAHEIKQYRKDTVERILKHGRDQRATEQKELALPQGHTNVRGPEYYH